MFGPRALFADNIITVGSKEVQSIMLRCVSYHCNSIRNNSQIVKNILDSSDILFLQELMLEKSDLPILNDFHKDFKHFASVKDRESEGIVEGRPSGGVAIFLRRSLSLVVSPIYIDESMIGVIIESNSTRYLFMNVYLPCDRQSFDSLDNYRISIAKVESVIREQDINNVIIVGDLNADPRKGRFWKEFSLISDSLSMSCLDELLPEDTFTYLCPARSSTSWLDHVFCSHHLSTRFLNMNIDYEDALYDHFPLYFNFDLPHHLSCIRDSLCFNEFVDWNRMKEADRNYVTSKIEVLLHQRDLLSSPLFLCFDVNCRNETHIRLINEQYSNSKALLLDSTDEYRVLGKPKFHIVPGWNDQVKVVHTIAREKFLLWRNNGKPIVGELHDAMKTSRSQFKAALNNCRVNEKLLRNGRMANNLEGKNHKEFWRDVNWTKKNNTLYPNIINSENTPDSICEMFSSKYKSVLSKNSSNPVSEKLCKLNLSERKRQLLMLGFSVNDVKRAIGSLKTGIGFDNIHSSHLKLCPQICQELISMLFF